MKRYPSEYEGPGSAPARCIRLLDDLGPADGVVVDLGCGRGPLAEAVRERGLEYVGIDIDAGALAEVENRGFETHLLDLGGAKATLLDRLRRIAAGRPLAAVIAADLLEHLLEPQALLGAVHSFVGEGGSLIVSTPNVTHLNVAAKLLLGRWDLTESGLLDDTHLRFFSANVLDRLFTQSGWRQEAEADPQNPDAEDQQFPIDAPGLTNGTPTRELLRRLRYDAEPHGASYQFVRRFVAVEPSPASEFRWAVDPPPAPEIFATVLVAAGAAEPVRSDLATQTSSNMEILDLPDAAGAWTSALDSARGRYLCFAHTGVRLSRQWISAFEAENATKPGAVIRTAVVEVPQAKLEMGDANAIIASGERVHLNPLDLIAYGRPGPTVLSAYAVPAGVVRNASLQGDPTQGAAGAAVFLARAAELCGVSSLAEPTVAAVPTAEDGEAELDAVAASMDPFPLVLPAGSATRLLDLRRGLVEAHESLSWRLTKPLRLSRWLRRRPPEAS
jgi:SAM-dependent methyltransferase